MLSELSIRNFALIDHHTISFKAGMTVLTGETGAGKSIIIDALSLALGDRFDSQSIRHGTDYCDITAHFDLQPGTSALTWLNEQALAADDECIIRRTLQRDGKSRASINGYSVTRQQLRSLSEHLVDIHGQNEHQSLLKATCQRDLVDQYGHHQALLTSLKEAYQTWHTTKTRLAHLQSQQDQQDRRDFIEFQLAEWQPLALTAEGIAALEQEHTHLAHRGDTLAKVQSTLALLTGEEPPSLTQSFLVARHTLQTVKDYHPSLSNAFDCLDNASVQCDEAANDLQHYIDAIECDDLRLNEVEALLQVIYQLARKHRVKPIELEAFFINLSTELTQLSIDNDTLTELEQSLQKQKAAYTAIANQLSAARANTGITLSQAISEKMQGLGMSGGKFHIQLEALTSTEPNLHGAEKIEFMVSTNPGQPLQTLSKVASGGELSRISLAIQVILANLTTTPTLIFDEVDVGIGGPTAAIVGQLLRDLSHHTQVLCVTHLAQVAACGTQHYQISKRSDSAQTITQITALKATERQQEIARMLSGLNITNQSLAHAEELLSQTLVVN